MLGDAGGGILKIHPRYYHPGLYIHCRRCRFCQHRHITLGNECELIKLGNDDIWKYKVYTGDTWEERLDRCSASIKFIEALKRPHVLG